MHTRWENEISFQQWTSSLILLKKYYCWQVHKRKQMKLLILLLDNQIVLISLVTTYDIFRPTAKNSSQLWAITTRRDSFHYLLYDEADKILNQINTLGKINKKFPRRLAKCMAMFIPCCMKASNYASWYIDLHFGRMLEKVESVQFDWDAERRLLLRLEVIELTIHVGCGTKKIPLLFGDMDLKNTRVDQFCQNLDWLPASAKW